MESEVVKVKKGWAVQLKDRPLQKIYRMERDARTLQMVLSRCSVEEVSEEIGLIPGRFFEKIKTSDEG